MSLSPVSSSSLIGQLTKYVTFVAIGGSLVYLLYTKIAESSSSPEKRQQKTTETTQKIMNVKWLISENLGEYGIDMSRITETLNAADVPFSLIPRTEWPPKGQMALPQNMRLPLDLFSPFHNHEVIWKDDYVQIVIVNEQGRFHLLVKLIKESSFEEISPQDYVRLKQTITLIPILFKEVFDSPDFCEALVENKEKTNFGFEIFPAFKENSGEISLIAKDKRNLYYLSRGQLETYSLPPDRVEILRKKTPGIFSNSLQRQEISFPDKRVETHLGASREYRINKYLELLQLQRLPVMAVKSDGQPRSVIPIGSDKWHFQIKPPSRPCFLCAKKKEEEISERQASFLITNIYPYVYNKDESQHVLLSPLRHVVDSGVLTDQEIRDERDLILRVKEVWSRIHSNKDFFAFMQHGVEAGQTQEHLHTQIVTADVTELSHFLQICVDDFRIPAVRMVSTNAQFIRGMQERIKFH